MCGSILTEEVEMEILMEEELLEDDEEFSSEGEEEVEEGGDNKLSLEVTSPKMPAENKKEATGSLGFSQELSSILASKMMTLNDSDNVPRGDEITKEKETNTKETGKVQQRRKPPLPPTKPKVWYNYCIVIKVYNCYVVW